jgi:hypothetical protein
MAIFTRSAVGSGEVTGKRSSAQIFRTASARVGKWIPYGDRHTRPRLPKLEAPHGASSEIKSLWQRSVGLQACILCGGERGIRTLEGFYTLHAFQACAIDHSATSPTMVATHPVLPKARRRCYRCSLPGLAEFTTCRLQGTKMGHHGVRDAKGISR